MQDRNSKNDVPTKLLWIDLEMTGLDPTVHTIVEFAAIVTDFGLQEIDCLHGIIHQPESILSASNEFSLSAHTASGLYDLVRSSELSLVQADDRLANLVANYFPGEPAILAGNSIHADRKFIDVHLPHLASLLHYRMLDVSSFKIWWRGRGGEEFAKTESHRALDDIRESMSELQYYTHQGVK